MIKKILKKVFGKFYKDKTDKTDKKDILVEAVKIIEKKKIDDTIGKVIESYVFSIKNNAQYAHSDLFKTKTELLELEFRDLLENTIGWEYIENEMYRIYNQLYTKEELDQMIVFYSTELGQKLLDTQDNINTMKMYFVNDKLQENQDELGQIFGKVQDMPFNN